MATIIITLKSINDGTYRCKVKIKRFFRSETSRLDFTKMSFDNYLRNIRQHAKDKGHKVIYQEKINEPFYIRMCKAFKNFPNDDAVIVGDPKFLLDHYHHAPYQTDRQNIGVRYQETTITQRTFESTYHSENVRPHSIEPNMARRNIDIEPMRTERRKQIPELPPTYEYILDSNEVPVQMKSERERKLLF